ncbi:T9SS type A sorting domain-containing protein [uncultured Draconibacterium sp.]|uniref:T9SS type A sorting domain-containing protein n=1 Tax=uncultured Draconibacterium sp. TaxID=1573823 RepID=UPI0032615B94
MKKVLLIILCTVALHLLGFSQTVTIHAGEDIQEKVDNNPAGTTFNISAGVHRMQSISPKDNQKFIGEDGAVLNGSLKLTNWVQSGSYWYHTGVEQNGSKNLGDWCEDDCPRCHWPEDLFKNDVPLKHVDSKSAISNSSEWYFEEISGDKNDKVWINFNPASFVLELSVTPVAINPTGSNVTIDNLEVVKYASPTQWGAIGGSTGINSGTITNCNVYLNHGVGIHFTGTSTIKNNKIHNMGQLGIKTKKNSVNSLIEGNEIYENKYTGYAYGIEGGGSKFARSVGLILRDNYVHHNIGPGLWTDIDNESTLYEGNICEYNHAQGIFHEISYDAEIRCNIAQYNNVDPQQGVGGNIYISNSSNAIVHGNVTRTDNQVKNNGITVKCTYRSEGDSYYPTDNNKIYDNDIYIDNTTGFAGMKIDDNCPGQSGNSFYNNRYHVQNKTGNYFIYGTITQTGNFTWMQNQGQEIGSTIDENIGAFPKYECVDGESIGVGISHENNLEHQFQIYPNPNNGTFNIEIATKLQINSNLKVAIYNMQGKLVHQQRINKQSLKMLDLKSGLYFVKLMSDEFSVTKRLMIK